MPEVGAAISTPWPSSRGTDCQLTKVSSDKEVFHLKISQQIKRLGKVGFMKMI